MPAFGVPIEGLHTETGPGVYEVAIMFSEALEAADRAILFKTGTKEIGSRFGIMRSFGGQVECPVPELQRTRAPEFVGRQKKLVLRRQELALDEQAVRKLSGRAGGLLDGIRADVLADHQQSTSGWWMASGRR